MSRHDATGKDSMLRALAAKAERDSRDAYIKAAGRYGVHANSSLGRKIARHRGFAGTSPDVSRVA